MDFVRFALTALAVFIGSFFAVKTGVKQELSRFNQVAQIEKEKESERLAALSTKVLDKFFDLKERLQNIRNKGPRFKDGETSLEHNTKWAKEYYATVLPITGVITPDDIEASYELYFRVIAPSLFAFQGCDHDLILGLAALDRDEELLEIARQQKDPKAIAEYLRSIRYHGSELPVVQKRREYNLNNVKYEMLYFKYHYGGMDSSEADAKARVEAGPKPELPTYERSTSLSPGWGYFYIGG